MPPVAGSARDCRRIVTGMIAFIGLVWMAAANPVAAQMAGDTATGHQLAKTWCAACHLVDPEQKTATSNGAPTFAAIAAMKSTTVDGLRVFLQVRHARMPDLHLSRAEIDDVSAYILTLRR